MDIHLVVIEDSHADTDVIPYRSPATAVVRAYEHLSRVPEYRQHKLTDRMREAGWTFFATYGDGSSIVVVTRKLED